MCAQLASQQPSPLQAQPQPLLPPPQAQQQQQQQQLTSQAALDALNFANGNTNLAAERLHVSVDRLVAVIAEDELCLEQLNHRLRVHTALASYSLLTDVRLALSELLSEMQPKDMAKLFVGLIEQVQQLTDSKTTTNNTNINIVETVIRQLPPAARSAFLTLIGPQDQPDSPLASPPMRSLNAG